MSNGTQYEAFNLERKLNEVNLTPSQREHAVSAMKVASDTVEIFEAITAAVKRVAGAMSLKPSVRA
jgi:hypothetical protein